MPTIPQDKAGHFIYGLLLALAVQAVLTYMHGPTEPALAGMCASLGAGLAKEALDAYQNRQSIAAGGQAVHGVEAWDAGATTLGGAAVYVASNISVWLG